MYKIKIASGLLLGTLLVAACILGTVHLQERNKSRQIQEYYLGDPEWSGYVGVTVSYDMEPVNVLLVSPSGITYGTPDGFFDSTREADIYRHDEKNRLITVLVDTEESGGWSVRFPRLSNTELRYTFLTRLSPTLYLKGADEITEDNGKYWITFMPIMDPEGLKSCHYSVILEQSQYSRTIGDGEVPYNQYSKIPIEPPSQRFDGTEYTIKLTVTAPPKADDPDGKSRTAHSAFPVVLEPGQGPEDTSGPAESVQE